MDREKIDRWCEGGILALVLSILIFGPLAIGAVRTLEFVVIQVLAMGVLFLWAVRLWFTRLPVLYWPPICWPVLGFLIYAVGRYYFAPIEYIARFEFIKVIVYSILFLAILNNFTRPNTTQIIAFVLIGLAFALSIFAAFQFFTGYEKIWGMTKPEGYWDRGSGTFMNPNHFAGFVELILPLALAYSLMGRLNTALTVILSYASLVLLVGIGFSLSRGGWIAALLTLIGFFIGQLFQRDFRKRSIVALTILLLVGIAGIAKTQQSQIRVREMITGDKIDNDRFRYWNSAVQIWRENIWFGSGPAHYDYRFREYRPETVQGRAQYVHNDYLNTLADWGLVGLAFVFAFVVLFYISVFKTWRFVQRNPHDFGARKSNKMAFVYGGAFALVAMLIHSILDFNMHIPANAITLFVIMAVVATYLRYATETHWRPLQTLGKISFTLISLVALVYLGQQSVRQTREELWLRRAVKEPSFSDGKLAMLQQSFAADPKNFEVAHSIGEIFRMRSWAGTGDYESLAREATNWFARSIELNPYHPYTQLRMGMTLDWLNQTNEAGIYFEKAQKLDPNGYYTAAMQGWHHLQLGDYATARKFFERSQRLQPNEIAESHLELIEQKLAEQE